MSGLVSYSYDPSSDQELSDSPYESQPNEEVKSVNKSFKEQSETLNREVYSERERNRREEERHGREEERHGREEERHGREEERDGRERGHTSRRREREYSSPHRKSHKHRKHRKSRHSSSDSDSPDRHRSREHKKSTTRHSPSSRRRHEDRDHSERSYRSRRGYTPPRTITSARSPPKGSRSMRQGGAKGGEQNQATSSAYMQPGNPYGMSQEKFKNLQNKKKMLWSKDSEELILLHTTQLCSNRR
eukprot:TRINITY_DN7853_c0_g3_i8.p1 TRINITY_DN7853_c0_g3~~TRINITY_DN7853_c0_g3_i8.p1  ORF type:complete len:246 (+),score=57.90 TRINITY_DN7853_c0_g3_i8:62-799(+)